MNLTKKTLISLMLIILTCTINIHAQRTRNLDGVKNMNAEWGNWCWAICIASIANYYGHNGVTQCDVANARRNRFSLGATNCCNINRPPIKIDTISCGLAGVKFSSAGSDQIGPVLQNDYSINNLRSSDNISYLTVQGEIDSNRPISIVACNLDASNRNHCHNMIIIGYNNNGQLINYIDPGNGNTVDYYTDSYFDITTSESMGIFNYRCDAITSPLIRLSATYQLISNPNPIDLELFSDIGFNADIEATTHINAKCKIINNSVVNFSSPTVTLNPGFSIELGCSLVIGY